MRVCLLLALLLPLSLLTQAGEDQLRMVGQARLQVLFWPVYDSRLYSHDGAYSENQRPLRLEIEYLRDIGSDELVDQTRNEWRRMGVESWRQQQWLPKLAGLWPDVGANDVLALELDEQGASTFTLNGKLLGAIEDPEFGQRFLAIWLSPDTSRPELRRNLIGAN